MLILSTQLPSTRTLQCFLAVAQELNFRSAAALLHMSQPPLTRQIQGLEAMLRVQLFARDTRGVRLTPAGDAFRDEAQRILAALDGAVGAMRALEQRGAPRIGLSSAVNHSAIAALAGLLADPAFAPGHDLARDLSRHLVERVRGGALDLAIVGDFAAPGAGLRVERVGSEALVAMLPAGHPAADSAVADFARLAGTALFWFSRSDNPAFYDKCEHALRSCGYAAPRRAEPRDFSLLLAAVADGLGFALCPQSMQATTRAGVVYRALPPRLGALLAIELQLVVREGETRASIVAACDAIRAAFAQAPMPAMPSAP